MPFSNPETRRAYDRARYALKHGLVSNPGNGSNPNSLPEFVPRGDKIPELEPSRGKRQLVRAENWFRNHSTTLTGVVIPLAAGVGVGFFGILFSYKYLAELGGKAKAFLAPYLPASTRQPGPVKSSFDQLLDFGQDYIDRSSTFS